MAGSTRTASLRILLEASGAAAAAREIAKVDQAVSRLGKNKNLRQVGGGIASAAAGFTKLGVAAAAAAAGGIVFAARSAIQYEDAFAGVRKTVDATETQFTNL